MECLDVLGTSEELADFLALPWKLIPSMRSERSLLASTYCAAHQPNAALVVPALADKGRFPPEGGRKRIDGEMRGPQSQAAPVFAASAHPCHIAIVRAATRSVFAKAFARERIRPPRKETPPAC